MTNDWTWLIVVVINHVKFRKINKAKYDYKKILYTAGTKQQIICIRFFFHKFITAFILKAILKRYIHQSTNRDFKIIFLKIISIRNFQHLIQRCFTKGHWIHQTLHQGRWCHTNWTSAEKGNVFFCVTSNFSSVSPGGDSAAHFSSLVLPSNISLFSPAVALSGPGRTASSIFKELPVTVHHSFGVCDCCVPLWTLANLSSTSAVQCAGISDCKAPCGKLQFCSINIEKRKEKKKAKSLRNRELRPCLVWV